MDAIRVYCDFVSGETCVHANPDTIERRNWWNNKQQEQKHIWFGETIKDGVQVTETDNFAAFHKVSAE